nr:MAG TPA_asm: hypothetical protein [Caudoviricetes sp.]
MYKKSEGNHPLTKSQTKNWSLCSSLWYGKYRYII